MDDNENIEIWTYTGYPNLGFSSRVKLWKLWGHLIPSNSYVDIFMIRKLTEMYQRQYRALFIITNNREQAADCLNIYKMFNL